jgi:hypothetical protein
MRRFYRASPFVILLLYILGFLYLRHPGEKWDRIINSDGKGYYGYLPAIFIYHDLSFGFIENYEARYYPADKIVFKEYRIKTPGGTVNKCFAGLAIAWLPFFLTAHLVSYIMGFEMDGYSILYQYSILIAALFYLWLGLFVLFRLLKRFNATDKQAAFVIFLVAIATNLPYYTIIEASMSHVFAFALITVFLYSVHRLLHDNRISWFVLSAISFAVIILIRPTNGLILLLVPFFSEGWKNIRETLLLLIRQPVILLAGIAFFLVIIAFQVIIWYIQTGHFIVYSYGSESFNFGDPQFFRLLFSYNRGWFVYTPAAFVSLIGFRGLYRDFKLRSLWVILFLVLFVYVASSWWMWYYASKCGQRVFVDIYAIVGILLLYCIKGSMVRAVRYVIISVLLLLTVLNVIQFYQQVKWIIPATYITREIYWDSFGKFHPEARVYLPEGAVTGVKSFSNDMEKEMGWINERSIFEADVVSGKRASRIDSLHPYSVGFSGKLSTLVTGKNAAVRISAYILSKGGKSAASLVVDLQSEGKSICYTPAYLREFAVISKWTRVEFAFYLPPVVPPDAEVKIYFYNPSKIPLSIDDLKIDFLSLKDEQEYKKIEGIKAPCH